MYYYHFLKNVKYRDNFQVFIDLVSLLYLSLFMIEAYILLRKKLHSDFYFVHFIAKARLII